MTNNTKQKLSLKACLFIGASFALISGCERSKPAYEFMPDMYESTSFKAQKEDPFAKDNSSNRVPPAGTVPRGYQAFACSKDPNHKAGEKLKNPLPRTQINVQRGQKIYNTTCVVCHGPKGNGQGYVVPPYPQPPSLLTEKVNKWNDGNIWDVITCGQNLMPSYATQIDSEDRWAVVHYVRALQKAANPSPEDIKKMKGN